MFITEFWKQDPIGRRTEKDDNSTLRIADLRKTRLTLGQLNRLRMMNDVRKFEHDQKLEDLKKQYAVPAEGAGMPATV
jgi:hypothetical protein